MAEEVDLSRLLGSLSASQTKSKNPPLYQTIQHIIQFCKQIQDGLQDQISRMQVTLTGSNPNNPGGGGGSSGGIINASYMTVADESVFLPFSLQTVEGSGVNFDDTTTPNTRVIMSPDMYHALVGGI